MTFTKIEEFIYIGNIDSVCCKEALVSHSIRHVLSVGCECPLEIRLDDVTYVSYPNIIDAPEAMILNIFPMVLNYISMIVARKERIAVNCVHGQSRSAAVIVAYLTLQKAPRSYASLVDGIRCLKQTYPSSCINPGFLAQLYFFACIHESSVEFRYAQFQSKLSILIDEYYCSTRPVSVETPPIHFDLMGDCNDGGYITAGSKEIIDPILCKTCRHILIGSQNNVLTTSADPTAFIQQEVDRYWQGYRSYGAGRSSSSGASTVVTLPLKHSKNFAVYPEVWMIQQLQLIRNGERSPLGRKEEDGRHMALATSGGGGVTSTEIELYCPRCHQVCGKWIQRGLNLLGPYNLCDLFEIYGTETVLKKSNRKPSYLS